MIRAQLRPFGIARLRTARAVGVSLEDRKALLGHKCGDVTTHYSALELPKVIEYVERPNTVLRLASPASTSPAKCDGRERTATLLMNGEILVERRFMVS